MKEIFCGFFDFFPQGERRAYGQKQQTQQDGDQIGQTVAQLQQERAEEGEVERATRKHPRRAVQADPAAPRGYRPDEQRRGRAKPEQKIQRAPQRTQTQTHPQHARQIVHRARRRAQKQRLRHGQRLTGDGDLHP